MEARVEPGVASRVCASARSDRQSLTTPKSNPDVGYEAISLAFSKKVQLSVFVIAHVGMLSAGTGDVPHWATALLSPSTGWAVCAVCAVAAASSYRVERALCFLSRIPSLASFICSSLISTPTYSRRSVADRRPAGRLGCW
jgi:hypothetical protein